MSKIISGTILLFFSGIVQGSQCPGQEWFNRKGTSDCYFLFDPKASGDEEYNGPNAVRLTFRESVRECQMRGGEIATFQDYAELQWVEARITDKYPYYWIGLTYESGSWRWTNGNTTTPYFDIGLLPAPTTPPVDDPEQRKKYRGTLTYDITSKTIQFRALAESDYSTNGFICKGTFSARPWCKLDEGWTYYGGKCHSFYPDGETWSSASQTCASENGNLAVIRSQYEDDRMKRWLRSHVKEQNGWIGINIPSKTASTTVNDVKWVDGTPITGTAVNHWAGPNLTHVVESLPNGKSYCGMLHTKDSVWIPDIDYYWYDYGGWGLDSYEPAAHEWSFTPNCDQEHAFFCEAPRSNCPYGWREFDNDCYKFNVDTMKNYNDAQADCQKLNGSLATIKTGAIQGFVEAVIFTEMYYDDVWIGLQGSNRRYTWVDGTNVEYTAWGNTSVNPDPNTNVCGYAQNDYISNAESGKWGLAACTQRKGYLCKTPGSMQIPDESIIHPPVECEAPFVKYHEGCYLVVHEQRNRDSAMQYCQDRHSILAYTTSFGENVWMKKQITEDTWLGIRREGSPGSWLEYTYSDGDYMGTGAFKNFYSSVYDEKKPCVVMASNNHQFDDDWFLSGPSLGEWYHAACTDQREFICYHPGTPIANPTFPPDHSDPLCGAGWFRNGQNCYRISDESARWHLAKQTCQNLAPNSDLLYITTKEEETFLSEAIADDLFWLWPREYWIGLYSEERNGWHWPYRNSQKWEIPLAVTNWAYMEPAEGTSSFFYNPRCVKMDSSFNPEWYAVPCNEERLPYICKKTLENDTQSQLTTRAPTPLPGQHLGCPANWGEQGGRCIRYMLTPKAWSYADQECQVNGGHLVTIRNEAEFAAISRFGVGTWIGLNAIADPGTGGPRVFVWSSGEEVKYTPWDVISVSNGVIGSSLNDTNCVGLTSKGLAAYSCHEAKSFICERPLQSTSLTNPVHGHTQWEGCQVHGIRHHDSCFYFGIDPNSPQTDRPLYNFDDANAFCQRNYGGYVATVADANEQKFLNGRLSQLGTDFWIGMIERQDSWEAYGYWLDGTPVEASNWATGQPAHSQSSTGGFKAGCVAMHGGFADHRYPGDWYVAPCEQRKNVLCKAPSTYHEPHPTFPSTPIPTGCPSSWKTSKDFVNCYKAYTGNATDVVQKVTWREAEDFCSRFRGGHLASIETSEENEFIRSDVQQTFHNGHYQYWIGLWDRQNTAGNQFSWGWTDGSRYSHSGFHVETHEDVTAPNCVAMDVANGNWIPQSCNNGWGSVCEIPKGNYYEAELVNQFPTAILPSANCGPSTPEGTWYLEPATQECMYFSLKEDTWENAQAFCESEHSNLVTVTEEAYPFIQIKAAQFSTVATKYWLGLYQVDIAGREFAWVDGHFSAFRKWEQGQPEPRGTERCVTQNSRSGRWADENCGHNYRYICAKSGRVRPSERPTRHPSEGGCNDGWLAHGGNCYYISGPENVTWDEAHEKCTKELTTSLNRTAGDLASIHDEIENDFLITQMHHRSMFHDYWLGLHELTPKNWGWSDNSRIRYTNWHLTETHDNLGLECVTFGNGWGQTGRWYAHRCTRKTAFICKAPKDPQLPPPAISSEKCGNGWTEMGTNRCFAVFPAGQGGQDWDSARDTCRALQGGAADIATIDDIYEDSQMHVLFHHLIRETEHVRNASAWIGMTEHLGNYKWYNTCPVRYTNFLNFATSLPDACVAMDRAGKWRVRLCNETAQYVVCERRFEPCRPSHPHNGTHIGYCPENFPHECNSKCFRVEGPQVQHHSPAVYSRMTAAGKCTEARGMLASVRSEEEQTCLTQYLGHAAAPMWIGLYEAMDPRTQRLVWKWDDDSSAELPTTFVNWETGHPKPALSNSLPSCVAMAPSGKWVSMPCHTWDANQTRGYICEGMKIYPEGGFTQRPHRGSTSAMQSAQGDGLSGGQIAGIVIGVLLAVAVVGGIGYVVMTGKTQSVVSSVKSTGQSIRSAAGNRFGSGPYARHDDKQKIEEDPEFNGGDQSYT